MKMILRTALQCQILALLLLLSACSSIPARTTASLAQGPLQIEVEALRIASNLPALGVLEIRNGVVVQSAMTGVRKWGDPTPALITDQFHLGSCTKAMTATLFAMLVDEGKVRWNSTLSEQFPEISNMNPVFKSVTLEMLLAHRGGLITSFKHINAGKLQAQLQDEKTTPSAGRQLLAETLLSAAPSFPPGSQFNYANAGYIIVGRVIEKLSGQTWEQFITQRLFQPLQMKSCGFGPPGNPLASPPDQPWPHRLTQQGLKAIAPYPSSDNPATFAPAGNVHCSLEDWGKFIQLHIQGFNHEKNLLVTVESMTKLHTAYPNQDYAYGGWGTLQRRWAGGFVLAHEGSNTLNLATVYVAPLQKRAFLAVTNLGIEAPETRVATQAAIEKMIKLDLPVETNQTR